MQVYNPKDFETQIDTLYECFKDWVSLNDEDTSLNEFRDNCFKEDGWIDQLESGKHHQARDCLKKIDDKDNTESFCCLGVYAEKVLHYENVYAIQAEGGDEYLNFSFIPVSVQQTLAKMNDKDALSFPTIAYVIKEAFKRLDQETQADKGLD